MVYLEFNCIINNNDHSKQTLMTKKNTLFRSCILRKLGFQGVFLFVIVILAQVSLKVVHAFNIILKFGRNFFSNYSHLKKKRKIATIFKEFVSNVGHVRSHTKFRPDQLSRFDVYRLQANKQTPTQTSRLLKQWSSFWNKKLNESF